MLTLLKLLTILTTIAVLFSTALKTLQTYPQILQMKGHVLHCACAHLKVLVCLLIWNALLTKKLPMFLLHLKLMEVVKRFYQYRRAERQQKCL